MRNYMSIICTILFYVCSSHAQTPLNDISGTNTIYNASEVDYRLESRVPTNRTITVGGQVGSLETNLVFASTGTGVTESTVTNIAQAVVTSNVPTLAQVASSGGFAGTETISPLVVTAERYGVDAGNFSSGSRNYAIGYQAGRSVIGTNTTSLGSSAGNFAYGLNWNAIGLLSGDHASGNEWTAIGSYAGEWVNGTRWTAVGYKTLSTSICSNSTAIGNYAGKLMRGNGFLCLDNYTNAPPYQENFGTNDALYIDNGRVSIGRTGSKTNTLNNVLRGAWKLNGSNLSTMEDLSNHNTDTNAHSSIISSLISMSNGTATNLSVFSSFNLLGHIITWNSDRQTFDIPLFGGVTGQLFQEQLLLVRNQTGANIANGKIVCSAGAVGDNAAIRKASSSDASCAWGVLGMVTQDAGIDHGSNGLICTSGEVNNLPLPTSVYQPSNTLWLATDGNYTNVEPQNVAVKYQIGIVLRAHASQGRILLNPQYIAPDRITSQSIIRDIVTSTNVVRVTSTQSVYVATVSSPCVITQDVSALSLATNQTAFWTTRINITDWSATNRITFATNIAAYAGDFTVTGCYDFACSLLCDGRIEMRQTFPTVYEWQHLSSANLSTATNASVVFYTAPKEDVLFIGLAHIKTSILAGYVYSIYYPAFTKYPASSSPTDIKVYTNSTDTSNISIPYAAIFTRNDYLVSANANSYGFSIRKLGVNDTSPHPVWQYMRRANELEIKAYNSGWRP